MANLEVILIEHFNNEPSMPPAFTQIPKDRPEQFIIIDRIGGGIKLTDTATIAIQCWNRTSRHGAAKLADRVIESLTRLEESHPFIGEIEISAYYNFPDNSGDNRYQIIAHITAIH